MSENTILIYMSDNGTVNGDKIFNAGMRGKKGSAYDGGHRVPFFIRWPAGGITGGRDIKQLAAHLDVWPTLTELCGLKHENNLLNGMSLAPTLTDASVAAKPRVLVESYKGTVLTERWRLLSGTELYDITADPAQENDVALQHPKVVEKLKEVSDKCRAKDDKSQRHFVIGSPKQNPVEFTPDDSTKGFIWGSQSNIYKGLITGSYSNIPVEVEQKGMYRIELSRWPIETGAAIRGQLNGEGKAFDIVKAHLKVQGIDKTIDVGDSMKTASFDVSLEIGKTEITGQFTTGNGSQIGTYYVTVGKL